MKFHSETQLDLIRISGLKIDCFVGIYPDEREKEQPLIIDIDLGLDFSQVVKTGSLEMSCDYDRMTNEIIALVKFRRFFLLEVATEELAAMLLRLYPNLAQVKVRLAKPNALTGRAKCASVEIQRTKDDYRAESRDTPFGSVETILETNEAGLYLLHLSAGKTIPPHSHKSNRELEWLVTGELSRNGTPVKSFSPATWDPDQAHGYENLSDSPAILFNCKCKCQ